MQTRKVFVGGVDGMFLTFFSPHQSWTQLTLHFCPFKNTSTKRSIQGTEPNVNRNRYGRGITLFLFLHLFLTKSRKKALVLIYCCLQRLLLTAYISHLTTHLGRQDICNCASESSNKSFVCNGQKKKTKYLGLHNIHKCGVNCGSHRKQCSLSTLLVPCSTFSGFTWYINTIWHIILFSCHFKLPVPDIQRETLLNYIVGGNTFMQNWTPFTLSNTL